MSRLVLIRHAKSDYPWGVADHDRPLNERGRRDAPCIGPWLDAHLTWEDGSAPLAIVSTARRAQLTWSLASRELTGRWAEVAAVDEPRVYEAGVPTLRQVLREAGRETLLLVGHNPGLAGVVDVLAAPSPLKDEAIAKFPTSAIAVLESPAPLGVALDAAGSFTLREFAVPRG